MNTYTHIPPISYIFVGVTAAILSYVTWVEMQEGEDPEVLVEESNEQVDAPLSLENPESINQEEEEEVNQEFTKEPELIKEEGMNTEELQSEKNKDLVAGGKKKRKATKKKRIQKNRKQTKHTKLKSR